jgi:hypothetical protein
LRYCLDSNVYIEAHRRYYAFDIAPGFWDGLVRLAEQQIICSPILVYNEIAVSHDVLAKWAKLNKDLLFVEIDDPTQEVFKQIVDQIVLSYEPHQVQNFLSGADPWVIAYAKVHQLAVVTMESARDEIQNADGKISGRIKIANICHRFDIPYKDTFALLREQKIVLR